MNAAKILKTAAKMGQNKAPSMNQMCRQLGIDPESFGDEAKHLWKSLTEMSVKDPEKYEAFLKEQVEEAKRPPKRGVCSRCRFLAHDRREAF